MTEWILSLIGMAFLGVMLETIMPNGKLNKFIKSMFSLFLLFVIVKPIPNIFNKKININNDYEYNEDLNFVESLNNKKLSNLKNNLLKDLEMKGISNVEISFDTDITKSDLIIKKVYVDSSKIVLKNPDKHINILDTILLVVTKKLNISEKEVVIYGS